MPPITPKELFRELEKQPNVGLRIARWWIGIGALVATFAGVMAVAHFAYDIPIQNNDTGRPATVGEIATVLSALAGGGFLFVVLGVLLRKWLRERRSGR